MITREAIKKLAVKYQTTELNIIREYFQHLFLSYFYNQKLSAKIFFKGGTALRIIYRSPRFSEDLNFSSEIKNISVLEDLVLAVLSETEREGTQAEIKESKKTSGGYLSIIHFDFENRPVAVQLEISFRNKAIKGEMITIVNDFIPPYMILQLSQRQLVEEKIQALLTRQKPRDFYDLYFMLRANLILAKEKAFLAETLAVLEKTRISFARELKFFLPQSQWSVIRNFQESLEREIKRHS